jgi:uncharacterized protein (DUF433 family)
MATLLDGLIEITPGVRGGQPRLAGTRITVSDLAIMYNRLGMMAEEIAGKYEVSPSSVHAGLSYYYSHRDEIDKRIAADQQFAEEFRRTHPGPVAEKLKAILGE